MRKSHKCHSEPQAKNLAFPATYKGEILRLSPQDDIATQSLDGEDTGGVKYRKPNFTTHVLNRLNLVRRS
jgi:hypothetical protein